MFKKQMKHSAFDKLKQLLRNSTHLIISIMTAALVYVLISDVRFLRRFIPSIQWETIYLLTWDAFLLTYLLLTFGMFAIIDLEKIKKASTRRILEKIHHVGAYLLNFGVESNSHRARDENIRVDDRVAFDVSFGGDVWHTGDGLAIHSYVICALLCAWLL